MPACLLSLIILTAPCHVPEPATYVAVSSNITVIDLPMASAPATRIDRDQVKKDQDAGLYGGPDVPKGLFDQPFAPEGLSEKDEFDFYRQQVGLPQIFMKIAYGESKYKNYVGNYCCHGYLALYFSNHMKDTQGKAIYKHCQVDEISDYRGDTPLSKQKNVCVGYGLYLIRGTYPWVQTR